MKAITETPPWLRRLGWFAGLWATGVLTITAVGAVIKFWLLGS